MDPRQPVLIMIQGPEPGSIHKLPDNRVTSIGRSSRNTIRVVSPSVSRFHCEVAWINGQWSLSDLNSRKGTMVNGQWVKGRMTLQPGDVIRMTSTIFRFDLLGEDADPLGAVLAIKEAELNARLKKKGEATGKLDDIIERSRLQVQSEREDRVSLRRSVKANASFLGMVAGVVAVLGGGLLMAAHGRLGSWLDLAPVAVEARPEPEGPSAQPPDPQQLMAAERERIEETWLRIEALIDRVKDQEQAGHYTFALGIYSEADQMELPEPAAALAEARRQLTLKLARASFLEQDREAKRLLQKGKRAEAREIYMKLRHRAGIEELARQARKEAERLN